MNRIILQGRLTKDIELKHIPTTGTAVGEFALAVDRRKDGVDFIDCRAWGKTAETMEKYLSKGRRILLEGRLEIDTWEKDGQKRSKAVVTVDNFDFIDSRREETTTETIATTETTATTATADTEEIPF